MELANGFQRRTRQGIGGPVILILLGVLFLLQEFTPQFGIGRTWPVILIVGGVLLLARSFSPPRPPRGPEI
ncbi:MAG: LiaI-LiaF-like domain-containing protein [Terriglobia bacterium]